MATRYPDQYRQMLERLRNARGDLGLTQEQVAEKLSEHQTYVSKVELGERRIDPFELEELARLYGRSATWFMWGDQEE